MGQIGAGHTVCRLPRGGATALRGRATELMGDVILVLLSERETWRWTKEKKEEMRDRERESKRGRPREKVCVGIEAMREWQTQKKSSVRRDGGEREEYGSV